jgi:malate permease and related proteins
VDSVNVLLSIFVSDILPVFMIASAGFVLARKLQASVKTLSHVSFYALTPCLAFKMLTASKITGPEAGRMVLMAVLVTAAMGLIARVAAIPLALSRAELSAFLLVSMFSNGGNYGLPVVMFAFGAEALSHGTVYFVTSAVLTYTFGVLIAAAGKRSITRAIAGIAKIPAVYGVAAAFFVLVTGLQVPAALMRPIGLLSDAALPMMILVLGMQLERATIPDRPWTVALAVALSLVAAPIVALGLASLLRVSGSARQASVILASMPVAVITTILALEFDVAPAFVTSAVFLSTILSPLTLTPLLAYLG